MFKSRFKSQITIEFLIITGIFLLALIIGVFISFSKIQEMREIQNDMSALNFLNKVSDKLNTVFLEGNGFEANLTLPSTLSGFDYDLTIYSTTMILEINNKTYEKILLTGNISQNLSKGFNILKNENGRILVLT